MCRSERTVGGATAEEVRYFIGSRRAGAETYGEGLRGHWGIEATHWQLDVAFAEDASRVRGRSAAANLALFRRVALGLLRRHPGKGSVPVKRLSAALDPGFLEEVLRAEK